MAQVFENVGLDSHAIFKRVNIDLTDLRINNARISNIKIQQILLYVQPLVNDKTLILEFSKTIKPRAFNLLGIAMEISQHSQGALKRLERFVKYLNSDLCVALNESPSEVSLKFTELNQTPNNLNTLLFVSSQLSVLKQISDQKLKVNSLKLSGMQDERIDCFEDLFNSPVEPSKTGHEIIFHKASAYHPFTFSNSCLTSTLDHMIKNNLPTRHEKPFSGKVKRHILEQQNYSNVDQDQVAEFLNLSKRTLQRKLKEEGVNYLSILDECRQETALNLIPDESISLSELTYLLGFTDASNFSRAFKRWSGSTPGQYRYNSALVVLWKSNYH